MTDVGSLVAVGRTSDVYEYGRGSVVKVPRPEVPDHWAALEAQFTAAVRDLGAPAPDVRDLVQVEGRDAVVFSSYALKGRPRPRVATTCSSASAVPSTCSQRTANASVAESGLKV